MTASESSSAPMRVLFVEDDVDIRAIVRLTLVQLDGMHVQTCADGLPACKAAADFGPDLLLLDATLPDMTGVELLAVLRSIPSLATVPAVFLTALVRPSKVSALQETHPKAVIAKPFDPIELGAQLRSCVA